MQYLSTAQELLSDIKKPV